MIEDIIQKISKYNILNYLLPGVLYCIFAKHLCDFNIIQENLFLGIFLYYFIGMLISRIGSILVGPILKKLNIVNYKEYDKYLNASKTDEKIDTLSIENNLFRNLIALFTILIVTKSLVILKIKSGYQILYYEFILFGIFVIIFVIAYRKQTNFINKRIENISNE